jgi:hypothetical protein
MIGATPHTISSKVTHFDFELQKFVGFPSLRNFGFNLLQLALSFQIHRSVNNARGVKVCRLGNARQSKK